MLAHGRQELTDGPAIQSEGEMLVQGFYSIRSNRILCRLLDRLWEQ